MNRKKSGIWISISGLGIIIIINLLDLIRGKAFTFGRVQAIITTAGAIVVIIGALVFFTKIPLPRLDLLKPIRSIENQLSRITDRVNGKTFDSFAIVGFALFAAIFTLGRWNGISPFIFIGGDASYISSYAASLDHPVFFSDDYFLSNTAHVTAYFSLHIPLLRFLNSVVGGYGNAFLVLLPITIFLKMLGFYCLGKKLLKNRWLALLLVALTYPIIYTGVWDYWGLLGDALPRNLFEIALPWLILWSIQWLNKPKRWYLLSFLTGLLVYVHSISAGIVFAVLTFIYLVQSPTPFFKRLGQLIVNVTIFVITILPFGWFFLSAHASAQTIPVSYERMAAMLMKTFGNTLLNLNGFFFSFVKSLWNSGILALFAISVLYLLVSLKKRTIGVQLTLALWISGILILSFVIPILESYADSWLHLIFLRMYLTRGSRFLPPLMIIFTFLVFFGTGKPTGLRFPRTLALTAVICIGICMGLILANNTQDNYFTKEVKCITSGHLACPSQQELDALNIINAVEKYTSPGDRILSAPPLDIAFTLSIRYQALRQLGYTESDVTRMDDDPVRQSELNAVMKPWNLLEHADESTRLASYLSTAIEMQGDYLILDLGEFSAQSLKQLHPVYQNKHYALVKVGS